MWFSVMLADGATLTRRVQLPGQRSDIRERLDHGSDASAATGTHLDHARDAARAKGVRQRNAAP